MVHPHNSDWKRKLIGLSTLAMFVMVMGLTPLARAHSPANEKSADFGSTDSLAIDEGQIGVGGVLDDRQPAILSTNEAGTGATPETITRTVSLTIEVNVPDFTPGTVYIYGNQPELGDWDPAAVPMSQIGPFSWTVSLEIPETTALAFNFGRGSQQTEETKINGTDPVAAREVTVTYGSDGIQHESFSVANWRDPIVVDHFPDNDASSLPIDTNISVSWSQAMGVGTDFQVVGPEGSIDGVFTYYINTYTYVFTPADLLAIGATYTVTVAGQKDAGEDLQQVPVQFTFDTMVPTSVELVSLAEKPPITDSWWWISWPWLMVLLSAMSFGGLVWIKRRKRQTIQN